MFIEHRMIRFFTFLRLEIKKSHVFPAFRWKISVYYTVCTILFSVCFKRVTIVCLKPFGMYSTWSLSVYTAPLETRFIIPSVPFDQGFQQYETTFGPLSWFGKITRQEKPTNPRPGRVNPNETRNMCLVSIVLFDRQWYFSLDPVNCAIIIDSLFV